MNCKLKSSIKNKTKQKHKNYFYNVTEQAKKNKLWISNEFYENY
jgi:hypothetical protein